MVRRDEIKEEVGKLNDGHAVEFVGGVIVLKSGGEYIVDGSRHYVCTSDVDVAVNAVILLWDKGMERFYANA